MRCRAERRDAQRSAARRGVGNRIIKIVAMRRVARRSAAGQGVAVRNEAERRVAVRSEVGRRGGGKSDKRKSLRCAATRGVAGRRAAWRRVAGRGGAWRGGVNALLIDAPVMTKIRAVRRAILCTAQVARRVRHETCRVAGPQIKGLVAA